MALGLLERGAWQENDAARIKDGRFVRPPTTYRNFVTADGSPGPTGEGGFPAEAGRYHLYVSLACPWAHRTLIFRKLKKLDDVISVSVVEPLFGKRGWEFGTGPGATLDTVNGKSTLADIYLLADPNYTGRVTVPVLVGQEAAHHRQQQILRNHPHAQFGVRRVHRRCTPTTIRPRCAPRSTASTPASTRPSTTASTAPASPPRRPPTKKPRARCSRRSISSKSGCRASAISSGGRSTEADWRLFTTLIRFDAVYYSHFKCNLRRIVDYPNLWNYLRDLYQVPGVAETVSLDHIKRHYYGSHRNVNPTGIVPIGPLIDFTAPHDRARFG